MKNLKRSLALALVLVLLMQILPGSLAEGDTIAIQEMAADSETYAAEDPAPTEAPGDVPTPVPMTEAPVSMPTPTAAEPEPVDPVEALRAVFGEAVVVSFAESDMNYVGHHQGHVVYRVIAFGPQRTIADIREFIPCNELTHWMVGSVYEYEYCLNCRSIVMSSQMDANGRELGSHFYADNVCVACGYKVKNTVHTETLEVFEPYAEMTAPVSDGNPDTHLWRGRIIKRTYVIDFNDGITYDPAKDVVVKENAEEREEHYFVDGVCSGCGYAGAGGCSHANVEVLPYYFELGSYINTGSSEVHAFVGDWMEFLVCSDCGSELTVHPVSGEEYPVEHYADRTEVAHSMSMGSCVLCGYRDPLEVSSKDVTMGVGEKYTLMTNMEPGEVTFRSAKSSIASVNKNTGEITAKKTGKTEIIVTAANGIEARVAVTVCKKPKTLYLSETSRTLGVGESFTLLFAMDSGAWSNVKWEIRGDDCVERDFQQIKAVACGTAEIRLTTHNGKKASCVVTVREAPEPEDMSLMLGTGVIGVGEMMKPVVAYTGNAGGRANFSIVEGDAAKVNPIYGDESIIGVKPGIVTVAATAYNGSRVTGRLEVKAAPTCVTITNNPGAMGIGETCRLEVRLGAEGEDCGGSYTFKSSNTKTAVVDPVTGLVTAKRSGTVKITVATYNGMTATASIKVSKAPKSVQLNASYLTLGVGESALLLTKLSSGSAGAVMWNSDNENCVRVENGRLTALAEGTAKITAMTYNGKTASCMVTVKTAPTDADMSLTLGKNVIGVGEYGQAKGCVSENCAGAFVYRILEGDAALVNEEGDLLGVNAGTVTVAAVAYNGAMAVQTLEVKPAPSGIAILNGPGNLGIGETYRLEIRLGGEGEDCAGGYTFKSNKTKTATVDPNTGVITPKRAGTVRITVTTFNGKSATVTVKVSKAPKSVQLNASNLTMGVGETAALLTKLSSGSAGSVAWSSDNENCVRVENGRLTALAEGTAKITAMTYNGRTASCAVTVKAAPTDADMSLVLGKNVIGVGEYGQARGGMSDGCAGAFTYRILAGDAALVNDEGKLLGVSAGTVTIAAVAYNGAAAVQTMEVKAAPSGVTVVNNPGTMGVGQKHVLQVRLSAGEEACAGSYTFTSSKTSVATVDKDTGEVTARRTGTVRITVTTYNKKKATITIKVVKAANKLALSETDVVVGLGESYQLIPVMPSGTAAGVVFTSSHPEYVSVTPDGVITGLQRANSSDGVTITATTHTGVMATCQVRVGTPPTGLMLGNDTSRKLTMVVTQTSGLSVNIDGNAYAKVEYEISDPSVLQITYADRNQCCFKALKAGTAVVTARLFNGLEDSVTVTVEGGAKRIEVELPSTLVAGYDYNLEKYMRIYDDDGEITAGDAIASVSISSHRIAVINQYRQPERFWIATKIPGSFTLTITAKNGKVFKKTYKVTKHKKMDEIPGKFQICYWIQE